VLYLFSATHPNSVNNCIYIAVSKIFKVSFNNVDFIQQMTGLTSLHVFVAERCSRFFRACCTNVVHDIDSAEPRSKVEPSSR